MRDLKQVPGQKRRADTPKEVLDEVRLSWPGATMEGSLCSYSFWLGKKLVGEAWMSGNSRFWWYRVLKERKDGQP